MVKLIDPQGNVAYETENEQAARLDSEIKGEGWLVEKIMPPEPEKTTEEITKERITMIEAELSRIDRETIRPLRAIQSGKYTEFDATKLANLEAEAAALRDER